ncbi:hypothetical protein SAMN05660284_00574 [Formivibrio citricus]|uniref:Uncharacterized protein n=1 Tax=Formivibrio citricus TaxID=83765 RepID=A0A1I4WF52_9NEIS|nr:DUF6776 family protein [Formivibrio citricus]SFN12047.1 hypothetical protein SAMN05660284_00574 [Formivibrio citricus]
MPIKRFYRQQRAHLASAPMALRPAPSRRMRIARAGIALMFIGGLLAAGGWLGWIESKAAHSSGFDAQTERVAELEKQVAAADAARRLAEQRAAVEIATRETLTRELAQSQAAASSRLETLTFLESLLTVNDRARALRFVACELQSLGDGRRFRYRGLLAQGFNSAAEFNGRLVVGVDYLKRGQRGRYVQGEDKPQPVHVKHYERLEGVIELPSDAQPQLLDARILSHDGKQVVAQCQKKVGGV